jgi:hypothetical protein
MVQILNSASMLNTTRLLGFIVISALSVHVLGCEESKQAAPPEPMPSIHPGGIPPAKALPPAVSAAGVSTPSAKGPLKKILEEREMYARITKLSEYLSTAGPESLDEARDLLRRQDDNIDGAENVLLARYWAIYEPLDATRWAMLSAPLGFRLAVTLPTMEVWAIQDPYAAQSQVQALAIAPGASLIAADMGLIRGWFQSEQPGLETYIRGMGVGSARQRALRILARQAIKTHGAEWAAAWPGKLPDDDIKFKLNSHRQFAIELGKTHPAVAINFCATICEHPDYGDGVMKYIAQNWARRDGPSTMAWLKGVASSPQQRLAVLWGFKGWFQSDRDEVTNWLEDIGPENIEPWLHPLLAMFSVNHGKTMPERGLLWAAAIPDEIERDRTMRTIAINWRRNSPEDADVWLATSPLSEDDRRAVQIYGRPESEVPNTSPGFNQLDEILENAQAPPQ